MVPRFADSDGLKHDGQQENVRQQVGFLGAPNVSHLPNLSQLSGSLSSQCGTTFRQRCCVLDQQCPAKAAISSGRTCTALVPLVGYSAHGGRATKISGDALQVITFRAHDF